MIKSRQKFSFWLIAGLCLLIVAYVSLKAHEGEEAPVDIEKALESNSVIEVKAAIDSAYAQISATYATIEPMFKKSCFDCHSDQTNYPWYYKIPTINSMIDSDIKEARKHLDMSNGFPFVGHANQLAQLHGIRDEVEENDMPLLSYRIMHWGTTIEGAQQDTLFQWIDASIATLEGTYHRLGIPIPTEEPDGEKQNADDEE